jgi:TRAP-type uncharacterized transport system fused permease subunit
VTSQRDLVAVSGEVVRGISASLALYFILYNGNILPKLGIFFWIYIPLTAHASVCLGVMIALVLFLYPARKTKRKAVNGVPWYDIILIFGETHRRTA